MKTALLVLAAVLGASAQSQRPRDLGPGKLLVASRDLGDPNFSQSVVLLMKHDATSAMGVVLTRESRYTIGRLFPEIAKSNETHAYVGGPVSRTGVIALGRSKQAPTGAEAVVSDVWMTADKALLERMIRENANAETFRVYLGYTGWGGGQLENEVKQGAWHIFNADPAAVFAADVKGLWDRYIRRVEAQIATVRDR